jgi:hypothetical protein
LINEESFKFFNINKRRTSKEACKETKRRRVEMDTAIQKRNDECEDAKKFYKYREYYFANVTTSKRS